MPLTVLHLTGSATDEFLADLSLVYARDCWAATTDADRYDMRLAHVVPGGLWTFPADPGEEALAAAEPLPLTAAVQHLTALQPQVVLPQMFCLPGMTTYRSLLDLLGLPYLGNTAAVMGLAADKAHTRAVVAAAGVPVPSAELLGPGQTPTLPPPVVVKPVDADNSVGVTLVRSPDAYPGALAAAFAHSRRVLVESFVDVGREVRCGVVERDGELVCLPLEEYALDPLTRPIRGQSDKIGRDEDGGLRLEAKNSTRAWTVDVTDPVTAPVWDAARRSHRALNCRHYSLFDFRVDPAGRPWFLEAGLYCSFARQSVIPTMARAAGISLPDLFAGMIDQLGIVAA
ncbi:hypothetical protein GCM10022223_15080 [Kineosporia mesophila]|uniref:ATP-grasp domain-containing protein n=1 Tax=Kineosporia mesophila TaxID=566012 RepID=A0ABP6Z7R6_9ACTN|nr:hypothetical protein [Kineosporia mesophila]MCD5352984.1 hypothetical protein [Kineosporia mesophila]